MYGVGVFNEGTGELVGKEVVERERSKEDFKGVLRMVCEAGNNGRGRKAILSAKKTLQMLLLITVVNTADALSLPIMMSPMPESFWPQLDVFFLMLVVCSHCHVLHFCCRFHDAAPS